jgi:hypothetical protein
VSRRLARLALALLALLATAPAARADFGFAPDGVHVALLDAAGQPELRAGAHPDRMVVDFAFETVGGGGADGNVKDLAIDLPAGFTGDASAVPLCSRPDFEQLRCGPESRVGTMNARFAGFGSLTFPIYDLAPREGELAELGFVAITVPVRLVVSLRPDGTYGSQLALRDLQQNLPLTAAKVELWGVPADHQTGTAIPRKPFLTNPTGCDGQTPTTIVRARSWQAREQWLAAEAPMGGPLDGCEQLAFHPALALALDRPLADTPSGLSVGVTLPRSDTPDGLAPSHTREVAITFPGGLTLSPGVADGLGACDDERFGIGTGDPPACPASSKVGSVQLTTLLLDDPLTGGIYLARALPGERFRLFVTAEGRGVTLKLTASLRPDPETGQLLMLLPGLPQLPFDHIGFHFKDGPRAPIATPTRCGAGLGTARVTPYRGGQPARVAATIEIAGAAGGGPCPTPAPFAPRLLAGSTPAIAGGDGALAMTVGRADGEQALERVRVTLPAGVSARLARVARCREPDAAAAACPPASRVGSVAAEAGAGPSPLPLGGEAYLTGPYQGAPFGLALVLRAQAGPIDLGTVVIRAALRLDPADARLTVATDPLPWILAGVPLRLRTFAIDIDRPGFMVNPTSCRRTRVEATLTSLERAASSRAISPYALAGCGALPFSPAASLALASPARPRRGGRPGLTIALHGRDGQAALRSARIELPRALRVEPAAVATICTRRRADAGRCPRGSAIGGARVRTPLLPEPLTGAIHVVQPNRGTQPELWATVAGLGVRLNVRGTISAPRGGPIVSEFVELPDIPLSGLRLRLRGGPHGLLSLRTGLCAGGRARPLAVHVELHGQNGKQRSRRVRVHAAPRCAAPGGTTLATHMVEPGPPPSPGARTRRQAPHPWSTRPSGLIAAFAPF